MLSNTSKVDQNQFNTLLKTLSLKTSADALDYLPWENTNTIATEKISDCPEQVCLRFENQLYIQSSNLPNEFIHRLRRLALFSNQEFFKKQAMRFSTAGTPRYICAAHIENDYLMLPRGLSDEVENIFTQQGMDLTIQDKRKSGDELSSVIFGGKLKPLQSKALSEIVKHDHGILVAPTGFGKTVLALALIATRKINTLVLVHNRQLLDQWYEKANSFLSGIAVGQFTSGKKQLTGMLDIATYQSLTNISDQRIRKIIDGYGQIIVDECHHLPALNYELLLKSLSAKYVHGITATPQRQDGLERLMLFQLGPIRHRAKNKPKLFSQSVYFRETGTNFPSEWDAENTKPHISEIYQYLAQDNKRNLRVTSDVIDAFREKQNSLVLTERVEHAEELASLLFKEGLSPIVLHGKLSSKDKKAKMALLNQNPNEPQIIIATGKYAGEGFDLPWLDTLFITLPISWKGLLAQYAGRIQRDWNTKKQVSIIDYVDNFPTLLRMSKKRKRGYKSLGYNIVDQNE